MFYISTLEKILDEKMICNPFKEEKNVCVTQLPHSVNQINILESHTSYNWYHFLFLYIFFNLLAFWA